MFKPLCGGKQSILVRRPVHYLLAYLCAAKANIFCAFHIRAKIAAKVVIPRQILDNLWLLRVKLMA